MKTKPETGSGVEFDAASVLADAPVYLDVVSAEGRVLYANATQERTLGFAPGVLTGASVGLIYSPDSCTALDALFADIGAGEYVDVQHLTLRRKDRSLIDVTANIGFYHDNRHGLCARIAKFRKDKLTERLHRVERENEVLFGIVETARDAAWCIEFVEPVDLTAPDREIIRQVFENECYWRYCNDAMAQLYRLSSELDFNEQDVRDVFPRNDENEVFVQELIDSNFQLDGAPSLDQRYDGAPVQVENEVRAKLHNGQLHLMWGTVRDVSRQKLRERELLDQAGDALEVLTAMPDPVVVINDEGRIIGANPAVEWRFGWAVDQLLGSPVTDLVKFDLDALAELPPAGASRQSPRVQAHIDCRNGSALACELSLASLDEGEARGRAVIICRTDAAETPAVRRRGKAVQ